MCPADGLAFVTIYDFIDAVQPWLRDLDADIRTAKGVHTLAPLPASVDMVLWPVSPSPLLINDWPGGQPAVVGGAVEVAGAACCTAEGCCGTFDVGGVCLFYCGRGSSSIGLRGVEGEAEEYLSQVLVSLLERQLLLLTHIFTVEKHEHNEQPLLCFQSPSPPHGPRLLHQ